MVPPLWFHFFLFLLLAVCHPSCVTCDGGFGSSCMTCHEGDTLHFGRCQPACPRGQYLTPGSLCSGSCMSVRVSPAFVALSVDLHASFCLCVWSVVPLPAFVHLDIAGKLKFIQVAVTIVGFVGLDVSPEVTRCGWQGYKPSLNPPFIIWMFVDSLFQTCEALTCQYYTSGQCCAMVLFFSMSFEFYKPSPLKCVICSESELYPW